jgi:hypothetical protein
METCAGWPRGWIDQLDSAPDIEQSVALALRKSRAWAFSPDREASSTAARFVNLKG